jgi:zinc D-Ala-D-Ala dipeptidase
MCYKIAKTWVIKKSLLLIFSTILSGYITAQETTYKRPDITNKREDYNRQVYADSAKKMVELKKMIPGIVYDLRYATLNNFMKRLMYPAGTTTTFLRLPAARALQQVQMELGAKGLGLKIYDAYRPYRVTVKFWELVKDERYVANPAKGSGHNRGVAVDLTIINLETGKELNMGTGFDNFSDTAHHTFSRLPEDVLQNRLLLKSTMEKFGFKAYTEEWWHYAIPDAAKYEILDLEFRKLK